MGGPQERRGRRQEDLKGKRARHGRGWGCRRSVLLGLGKGEGKNPKLTPVLSREGGGGAVLLCISPESDPREWPRAHGCLASWHPLSHARSLSSLLRRLLCHFLLGSRCLLTQCPPVGRSPAIPARAQCQLPHGALHPKPSTPGVPVLAAGSLDDAQRMTPSLRTCSQMRASGLPAATVLGMGVLGRGKSSKSLHRRSLEPQGIHRQFSGHLLCPLLPWPHFALSLWDSFNLPLPPEESGLNPIKSLRPNSLRGTYSLSAWV